MSRLKFCHTCQIFRPERAFHCHFCGNCVHRFDHHCQWLGTCIGGRNYRSFIIYLFSIVAMHWSTLIYVLGYLSYTMHHNPDSFFDTLLDAIKAKPSIPVIIFFALITCGFTTHLLGYHLVVIGYNGMSTYESKKDHFVKFAQGNPYGNVQENRCYLLCRSRVT